MPAPARVYGVGSTTSIHGISDIVTALSLSTVSYTLSCHRPQIPLRPFKHPNTTTLAKDQRNQGSAKSRLDAKPDYSTLA
jgi:hypothetical protein